MFFTWKLSSARTLIISLLLLFSLGTWFLALYIHISFIWLALIATGLLSIAVHNAVQRRHTILRNYPLIGYVRYFMEAFRPELRQYLWESDLDGKPFNRIQRSLVYQRAKGERESIAFGTQLDVNAAGHEWLAHAVFPKKFTGKMRTRVGNAQCKRPYDASILNIGAMSYGALSSTAVSALNQGAQLGGFAHNTGEGGISDYHLYEADLIWQIGTGYFGCRDAEGKFDPQLFMRKASRPAVKMIELKLSQGAKPGLGGMLPGNKNTEEIARIRHVPVGTAVISPPAHNAFSDATQLIRFLGFLRALSDGKPVGIKLCIGSESDFTDICDAIYATNIIPDFITIDGAEGGTGAAPVEFSNHVGMPLYDAIAFVNRTLKHYGLENDIRIIASGKIVTGFDIIKALSLGAHCCYSARGMMLALGCVQALQCNSGKCPAGIATQDKARAYGLDVRDKRARVANYHKQTLTAAVQLMEAAGFADLSEISPAKIFRKLNSHQTLSFQDIYFQNKNDYRENWFKSRILN
ncbi:FMN-binding glutamate synthase family protein [Pedobacter faecalis]|uniref:FMN-binding glutamate synthase family protein n=1 Tax=Pedobacter faecalis TaxID=3041495 RepID=UPI00254D71CE|nr:FMN-binding glutamate synthase family protein [Pedobacter sp. ELA7]